MTPIGLRVHSGTGRINHDHAEEHQANGGNDEELQKLIDELAELDKAMDAGAMPDQIAKRADVLEKIAATSCR